MSKVQIPRLQFPKIIKDPILDYVPLTDLEYRILQLPVFNRLHDLKQTSMAYLVFPGAVTTRFQHSIGAMHLASQMVYQILQSMEEETFQELFPAARNESQKLAIVQSVRIAALLHDLGHGPLSHATEGVMLAILKRDYGPEFTRASKLFGGTGGSSFPAHEYFSYMLILKSETNELISKYSPKFGEPAPSSMNVSDIANLIAKVANPKLELFSPAGFRILRQIISSQLDADRMDYLVRDGYMTGVSYGLVDVNRVIMHLAVKKDRTGRYELTIHERALGSIEDVLDARFKMYKWVYSHHLVASANELLKQAITYLIDNGKLTKADFHWQRFADGYSTDSNIMNTLIDELRTAITSYKGLVDRRYLPVSLLKRPNDHIDFQKEIMHAAGRSMTDEAVRQKLKRWFDDLSDEAMKRKIDGQEVDIFGIPVARSPYSPLREGDTVWIYSEREPKMSELSHFSEYFRGINDEWTHFPSYFISYATPTKTREKAKGLWKQVRQELIADIASR